MLGMVPSNSTLVINSLVAEMVRISLIVYPQIKARYRIPNKIQIHKCLVPLIYLTFTPSSSAYYLTNNRLKVRL